jgi:hypothetical protein
MIHNNNNNNNNRMTIVIIQGYKYITLNSIK